MERTSLRCGIAMIIAVTLFPAVSTAGNRVLPGTEGPVKPGVSRSEGEIVGIARLLALLREVFGHRDDEGACVEAPCEKEGDNRVGIDPNGNS